MRFRSITDSIGTVVYRQIGRVHGYVQETRPLLVDVLEGDEEYLVVFDAPGAELENVQVRYLDGTVRIRIDRFREFYDGYELRFPGRATTLEGEADIPADALVDPDAGTATLAESGAVRIAIPKAAAADRPDEPAEADRIAIE